MHKLVKQPSIIGTKQTLRAINSGLVEQIYIAKDAQKRVVLRVEELAELKSIPIEYVDTMEELGKICNVEVKTATAALVK